MDGQSQWNFNIKFIYLNLKPIPLPRYLSDYRLVDSGERVRVETRMSSSGDTGTALSILNIDQVHLSDKGNYTCIPASGGQASISLHVLEGERD